MTKDWTGRGQRSIYSTLGASNHSKHDREQHDYYATEPSAIDDLFAVHKFDKTIWECACGEGHLSKKIEDYGKSVYSTDLIDRGYGNDFFDFLTCSVDWEGDIITNPPYKYAKEFVEKSMQILKTDRQLAMFLKLTFLEGQGRHKMFLKYPPEVVYVYPNRKKCALNGNFETVGSSAAAYAWFVWRKGFSGDPVIRWLDASKSSKQSKLM